MRLALLFLIALFASASVPATEALAQSATVAQALPARPSPPRLVNDLVGLLSATEADALERKLIALDDSTGTQVAVVIVNSTQGITPNEYATELGRAWGVGQRGTDNGVVLLAAMDDRAVYIATGYGAEGGLPDAIASQIVRTTIVPRFREGRFYDGLNGAVDDITRALSGEFDAPAPTGGGDDASGLLCFLLIVFVVLIVLSSRSNGGVGGGPTQRRGGRRRGGPSVIFLPGFGGGVGGSRGGGFGGGGFGGGGFGGFGGGSFGGGGAGGSW